MIVPLGESNPTRLPNQDVIHALRMHRGLLSFCPDGAASLMACSSPDAYKSNNNVNIMTIM